MNAILVLLIICLAFDGVVLFEIYKILKAQL